MTLVARPDAEIRTAVLAVESAPVIRTKRGWRRRGHREYKRRRGMPPELLAFTEALREAGASWVQIGVAVRDEFRVTMLVAMRLAHGWSQRDAAEQWNALWPEDLKTLKNFSYWERWPASGYAPSLSVLGQLAELYQCRIADLLLDRGDYRHLDQAGIGELNAVGHTQMVIGEECPHGCTVLAFAVSRPPAAPARLYTEWREAFCAHAVRRRRAGASVRRIAAELNLDDRTVRTLLREAGVEVPRPAGRGQPSDALTGRSRHRNVREKAGK